MSGVQNVQDWSYDLSTSVGQLRLQIGDTRQAGAWFTDAELAYYLSITSSLDEAAVKVVQTLLAASAKRGFSANQIAALRELLDRLGAMPTVGVATPALIPSDIDYDNSGVL